MTLTEYAFELQDTWNQLETFAIILRCLMPHASLPMILKIRERQEEIVATRNFLASMPDIRIR